MDSGIAERLPPPHCVPLVRGIILRDAGIGDLMPDVRALVAVLSS